MWDITRLEPQHPPGGNDSDSNGEEDQMIPADTAAAATTASGQAAYNQFLSFLEAGCHGSALQSYPAIVIVLSTLPSTVRRPRYLCSQFVLTRDRFCNMTMKGSKSFLGPSGRPTQATF